MPEKFRAVSSVGPVLSLLKRISAAETAQLAVLGEGNFRWWAVGAGGRIFSEALKGARAMRELSVQRIGRSFILLARTKRPG